MRVWVKAVALLRYFFASAKTFIPMLSEGSALNSVLGVVSLDPGMFLNPLIVLHQVWCDAIWQVGRYIVENPGFKIPDPDKNFEISD